MIARLLRRAADMADLVGFVLDRIADTISPDDEVTS